ncbi:MAG: metal ABC transporter substrate-binding protein [Dehalococcoidia bacterium]
MLVRRLLQWGAVCAMLCVASVLAACGSGGASSGPASPASDAPSAGQPAAAQDAGSSTHGGDQKLVAVSFAVLADIVQNIGRGRIEVWSVTPPGSNPHDYEVTPQDLVRLVEADYLITVGGHFEAFAERTAWRRAAREAALPTLVVTDSIDVIIRDLVVDHGDHTHDYRGGDPHFWLDPQRVIELIPVIATGLASVDPEGEDLYRANGERYAAQVRALDAEMEAAIQTIPPARRVLVVQHDAYGYLAARFGFEVLGSILPSDGEGETSVAALASLYDRVEQAGVPAVFREPQYESSILDQLARDQGITVGVLMTDAFTEDAPTYLDLIRFNMRSLVAHLR